MNWNEYLIESEKTVSLKFNTSDDKEKALKGTIDELIRVGRYLDKLKKSIFYGTDLDVSNFPKSEENTFKVENVKMQNLLHFIIGQTTESIELLELVNKTYYEGRELDEANLQEELGDGLWYQAGIIREMKYDIEFLMDKNIEKLHKKRYKNAVFTQEEAENRDINAERETLEKGI